MSSLISFAFTIGIRLTPSSLWIGPLIAMQLLEMLFIVWFLSYMKDLVAPSAGIWPQGVNIPPVYDPDEEPRP
jgi:hypothetical protein